MNIIKINKLVCALAIGVGHGAWAAGNIESVSGEANVIDRAGQPRAAIKGERVVEGETLATGTSGELVLLTDDSGLLAVRPLSRVLIEKYEISATERDTVSLRLLRGALRSITGWIGKTAPRNYRLATSTATVGIRGTDHETVLAEGGEQAGTYDRVYGGETALETAQGSVFVQSGQTARAGSRDAMPQLLAQAPAALYPERASDASLERLKQDVQGSQPTRLEARQQQNRRSGGTSSQGNPAISAQCTPNSPAQRAFDDFLRAYEQGNTSLIQQRLDPALIGYSVLINDIMRDANAQKQTQIRVLDRQMQCGPDVSVVDFAWEKRFIDVATFQPQLQRGRASVLISGLGAGQNGQWRISGFNGDNPFRTSASPAALQVSPATISYSGIPGVCIVSGAATASGSQSFIVNTGPVCIGSTPPPCSFTSPLFGTVAGSLTSSVTSCVAAPTTQFVTVSGSGVAPFSGAPGSTVPLSATFPAVGAAGGAAVSANFTCTAFTPPTIPPATPCSSGPGAVPVNFTVSDSARAGQGAVQVLVTGANGDRETLQLTATSPGNFSLMSLPIQKGAAVQPGSGRLEFAGPTSFTIAYRGANGVQVVKPFIVTP